MFPADFWTYALKPYARDPSMAFVMAQTFSVLRETLEQGPAGALQVMGALDMGIKELYQYSDVHEACFVLYQRLVSEQGLKPDLDPRSIVKHLDKPEPRKTRKSAKKK